MISASGLEWPTWSTALYRHWASRLELVRLPSFSMDETQGSMNTSVWISLGFMPGPFQKDAVSLSKRLTFTSHLSLVIAFRVLLALAPEQAGFWPQAKKPSNWPLFILSKSMSHEAFMPSSIFGSQAYPKSLSFVALAP